MIFDIENFVSYIDLTDSVYSVQVNQIHSWICGAIVLATICFVQICHDPDLAIKNTVKNEVG